MIIILCTYVHTLVTIYHEYYHLCVHCVNDNECYTWVFYHIVTVTIPPLIVEEADKMIPFRVEESIEVPCVATGEPDPVYVSYTPRYIHQYIEKIKHAS